MDRGNSTLVFLEELQFDGVQSHHRLVPHHRELKKQDLTVIKRLFPRARGLFDQSDRDVSPRGFKLFLWLGTNHLADLYAAVRQHIEHRSHEN